MRLVNQLDKSIFDTEKYVSIGKLSKKIVDFIIDLSPNLKGIISSEQDILFWKARVNHIQRHKKDFASDEEYEKCFSEIPLIIKNPDYISIHPTDGSVSFIKDYSGHTSVAIKISSNGTMSFRTMYPLRNSQLNNYIETGRAKKYN